MKSLLPMVLAVVLPSVSSPRSARGDELVKGSARQPDLGKCVRQEMVFIPPGGFMKGSAPEEKQWATGIEGGAQPGKVAVHLLTRNVTYSDSQGGFRRSLGEPVLTN